MPDARVVADVPMGVEALAFAAPDGGMPRLLYLNYGDRHADGSLGDRLDLWSVGIDGSDQHVVRRSVFEQMDIFAHGLMLPMLPGAVPVDAQSRGAAGDGSVRVTSSDGALFAYWEFGIDSSWICVTPAGHPDPRVGKGCLTTETFIGQPVWHR